jgi:glycosyltransferase involved in cell wall biosynthesis
MRIALAHDYLMQDGGAERTLLALHRLFPDAPIFTLFHDASKVHPDFKQAKIIPSFLNTFPFAPKKYQWYLPLMPHAAEAIDLSGYDVILSSSSSFIKGIIASPGATHICYCHNPTRFLWQERHGYVNDLPQPGIIKRILPFYLHHLRQWDIIAADRPDVLLTNSKTSQERIRRFYRREAKVIFPPVDTHLIQPSGANQGYWLIGGRLVGYKRFDLAITAFARLNLPLKVFGIGPEAKKLRALAGPKTEFVGAVDEKAKFELYKHAIGFLYPHVEDFGITAIEAMAAGKPVIAYAKGGITETVLNGKTGTFFHTQSWEAIANAILRFDPAQFSSADIRAHAEQFSQKRFAEEIKQTILDVTGHAV